MTYLCALDDKNVMHTGIYAVQLLHQRANSKFNKPLNLPIIKPLTAIILSLICQIPPKNPQMAHHRIIWQYQK